MNPYPNLGFNPTPGVPEDVAGLKTQIDTAAEAVRETNGLLAQLRNSSDSVWKGEAGDAFRNHFDATLAQDLGYAQKSLERAVVVLADWHTNLVDFRETAKGLDLEAATAKGQHAQAVLELNRARSNPDLGLANMTFSDQAELAAAQSRLNAANAQVQAASAAVDQRQGDLDSILQRARDLETVHDGVARRVAAELDAAAKDFAPSPPDKSIWDRISDAIKAVGDWIDEHRDQIHSILAATSAVAGLLALVTPPPISAIALGVSLVAGAGALALDLSDPQMRSDLMEGKLDAWMTVGGDAASLIPGLGALGKVGKVAVVGDAAGDIGRFEGMARAWGEAAHNPGIVNRLIADKTPVGDILNNVGVTNATHRVLQFTGVEGAHSVGDPAMALAILKRTQGSVTSLFGLGGGE